MTPRAALYSRRDILALGAEDRHSLDLELAAFVDHTETIKGIIMGAVDGFDDLSIIEQYGHFAVVASAPFDGMPVAVR
jgi:hypothetical protein